MQRKFLRELGRQLCHLTDVEIYRNSARDELIMLQEKFKRNNWRIAASAPRKILTDI
jgi:hypothetical protein